jgi:hypothetical protein
MKKVALLAMVIGGFSLLIVNKTFALSCPAPISFSCKTQNDLQAIINQEQQYQKSCTLENEINGVGGGCAQSSLYQSNLDSCNFEIQQYQQQLQTYQSCLQNLQSANSFLPSLASSGKSVSDAFSQYMQTIPSTTLQVDTCLSKSGYAWNSQNNTCVSSSPTTSNSSTVSINSSSTPSSSNTTFQVNGIVFIRKLTYGMTSSEVLKMQKGLEDLGYFPANFQPTTFFGKMTRSALIQFQQDQDVVPASGIFGPLSQATLIQKLNESGIYSIN